MENIFAQFSGADLDRLIKCIEKVRAENLTLDSSCQAAINDNSGNVYIWSENWAGTVYCSIGFDVCWSYYCGNCGEEIDFDTESHCRTYAEDHDYQCASCRDTDEE